MDYQKLYTNQKIQIIEKALELCENVRWVYMCNLLVESADILGFIELENNKFNDELFLKGNFHELCELASKYSKFNKLSINTVFKFDGSAWFSGDKKELKITLLKELLDLYKNQLV